VEHTEKITPVNTIGLTGRRKTRFLTYNLDKKNIGDIIDTYTGTGMETKK